MRTNLTRRAYGLGQRVGRAFWLAARSYVRIVRGGSEGAGLATLRALALGGPRYWLGLAVLVASLVATAYLSVGNGALALVEGELWEGRLVRLPVWALWLAAPVTAIGWTYLLSGAAGYGLGAYVLAAAYTLYYGLMPGLSHAARPWFPLLPLWLLAQGAWLASTRPGRWRFPLLLLLSLLVGLLTYKGTAFVLVWPWRGLSGQLALGVILFALAANPWALRPRPFRSLAAFLVTLGLFLGLDLLAILLTPPQLFLELTFLSLHDLLGPISLFWFWLGLDLFNSARDLGDWVVLTARELLSPRLLGALIWILWLVWMAYAYLTTHVPPLWLIQVVHALPYGSTLLQHYVASRPSFLWADTLQAHLYVLLGLVPLAVILRLVKRLSHERLVALFGLSLMALLVLWGGTGLNYAFRDEVEGQGQVLGFWPLLLYVGGMFWQVLKNSDDLVAGGERRLALFSGFLLCLAGVSLAELAAHDPYFQWELSLNTLNGIFNLGLPYLLYAALYAQQRYTPVSPRNLAVLFALGLLTAVPIKAGLPVWAAPLLWLGVVLATVWRRGRWDDPLDGPVYTVALALGFVTYTMRPVLIPVPAFVRVVGQFIAIQSAYLNEVIWPWESRWWIVLAGVTLVGGGWGYLCGLAHRRSGGQRVALLAGSVVAAGGTLALLARWL